MKKKIVVCLKERMPGEGRVALTPDGCRELVRSGHEVCVEYGAGEKSGYSDIMYRFCGANTVSVSEIIPFLDSEDTVVLKVKQPLLADDMWFSHMRNGILFAYFHSTGENKNNRRTIDRLLGQNITAISYENIEASLPQNSPLHGMSKIAGRLAAEWGEQLSRKARENFELSFMENGHLHMVVFGAGVVGFNAVKRGLCLGFSVAVFEKDAAKETFLREHLTEEEMGRVEFFPSHSHLYNAIKKRKIQNANILVGAVLVPGGHAPIVVSKEEVDSMSVGSVIVDVACDQGGCIWHPENETSSVFEYERKTLYCRTPNMPGSVPLESTPVLAGAIFPYIVQSLEENGIKENTGLRKGVVTHMGTVMNKEVASYYDEKFTDPESWFEFDKV